MEVFYNLLENHYVVTSILTATALSLLVFGRFIFEVNAKIFEKYSLTVETVKNDNPAVGIRLASFLLAMVISFLGMVHPSGVSFGEDLNNIFFYGSLAVLFLLVSGFVNDKAILFGFNNTKEVVGEKNMAVAIVEASTYLATAFIMAGALKGWEGGFLTAIIWFAIGQGFLVAIALLYRMCVRNVFAALDTHNVACGFSLGGFLLSGGIRLGTAVSGPVTSWQADLTDVAVYFGLWLVTIVVTHFVADWLMVPSARIRDEVMKDRNIGIGVLEAAVFVSTTLVFVAVW